MPQTVVGLLADDLFEAYQSKVSVDRYIAMRKLFMSHRAAMYATKSSTTTSLFASYIERAGPIDEVIDELVDKNVNLELYLEYRNRHRHESHQSIVLALQAGLPPDLFMHVHREMAVETIDEATQYLREYRNGFVDKFHIFVTARKYGASAPDAKELSVRPNYGLWFTLRDLLKLGVPISELLDFKRAALKKVQSERCDGNATDHCDSYAYLRLHSDGVIKHAEAKRAALEVIEPRAYLRSRLQGRKKLSAKASIEIAINERSWRDW